MGESEHQLIPSTHWRARLRFESSSVAVCASRRILPVHDSTFDIAASLPHAMRMTTPDETTGRPKDIAKRLLLALAAVFLTLIIAEIGLHIVDQPRVMEAHQETPRFAPTNPTFKGMPAYVNFPGRITFTYATNPRAYFNDLNQVHHQVNPSGFRGPPFRQTPSGARRLVFLGDSFTFGEGVRDEHTYAEVTARTLTTPDTVIEAVNLGVGGYNTAQASATLKSIGLAFDPAVVVLGYVPNDAEPALFRVDPASGRPVRRNREALIEAEGAPQSPPSTGLYRLRLARLIWQSRTQARLAKQTIAYYQSLYTDDREGWKETQRALRDIMNTCRDRNIPCIVVMFPVLFELNDNYPFEAIHAKVGDVVRAGDGIFIDLLPALKGLDAPSLWVHPTDQHPNERVHAIAGKLVAEALRAEVAKP
jgi:lysophospholipase L1-like esterase